MHESPASSRIVALCEFPAGEFFHITIVTETEVVTATMKVQLRDPVLAALRSGANPTETILKNAPKGNPDVISLANIISMEWHSDEPEIIIRYNDSQKGKIRKGRASVPSGETRVDIISSIKQRIGQAEEISEPASIWHTGIMQIIYGLMAFLISTGLAIAVHYQNPTVSANRIGRGRGRGLAELAEAAGPVGTFSIGLAIVAVMGIWWYIRCRNPPLKTSVKRISMIR